VRNPDCGAGCIFDNLKSKHLSDEKAAISLIFKAVGNENLNVVLLETEKKAVSH
jgi:hypothetical protein